MAAERELVLGFLRHFASGLRERGNAPGASAVMRAEGAIAILAHHP